MPDAVANTSLFSIHDRDKINSDTLKVDFLMIDIHHNRPFQRLSLCTGKGIKRMSEMIIFSLSHFHKYSISLMRSDDIYFPSMHWIIRRDDIIPLFLEVAYRDHLPRITDLTFGLGHRFYPKKKLYFRVISV